MLIDQGSELRQEVGLDGRNHDQRLAGEPGEERVANESVPEVRGKRHRVR